MCQRLTEIKAAMRQLAATFDASLLTAAEAATVVSDTAAIEHMAATVKALAAARAADAKQWKAAGHRSAEEELARRTGTSLAGAREALALGRRLVEQPDIADAARRGDLSPTQACAISDAAVVDPGAAGRLVAAATAGGSLADLKNQCAEIKAAAVDLEARRAAIRRRRYLRAWTDPSGEWHLVAVGNPEDGAQVMAALAPLADRAFNAARKRGEQEHPDAYRFDALVELAINATSPTVEDSAPVEDDVPVEDGARVEDGAPIGDDVPAGVGHHPEPTTPRRRRRPPRRGAPVKLLVRVDLTTFLRGFPTAGETCELVGYGPVSVSAVHDLIASGDPFITAILTKGKQVTGVAHLGRQPTAHQQSALEWLYPTCAAEGCPTPAAHLQIDHRVDWAQSHITLLDWLDALCPHDHAKKTRYGWSLVDGIGKRPFVPPSDPRHPHFAPTDRQPAMSHSR